MTRYKQAEFPDDDSSIAGIQLNESYQVRYHRATMNWRIRTKTEKWLMCTTLVMSLVILVLLVILLSSQSDKRIIPIKSSPCLNKYCIFASNEILKSIDTLVDPCEDFYGYACNQWIKNNPIPEGKSTWGTFGKLEQMNQLIIRNVLEKPLSQFQSEAEKKAKIYYESCLDKDEEMEKLGGKPMVDLLRKIGGWNVTESGFNVSEWKLPKTLKILHNRIPWDLRKFIEHAVQIAK